MKTQQEKQTNFILLSELAYHLFNPLYLWRHGYYVSFELAMYSKSALCFVFIITQINIL